MESRVHIFELMEKAKLTLMKYTYPLYIANQHNCPEVIGSSFFLKVGINTYLVTAAHVIDDFFREKSRFHVGGLGSIIQLEKIFMCSSEKGDEELDIAFCLIDDEFLADHRVNAIHTEKVYTNEDASFSPLYLAHGYPCVKNNFRELAKKRTKIIKTNAFTYFGKEVDEKTYNIHKMKKKSHIGVEYNKKSEDARGNVQKPPAPQGISGAGCWVMPSLSSPNRIFLAGMYTNDMKSAIYAIKIGKVMNFIRENT